MNKTELIDEIASLTQLEKTKVARVVNALLETVTGALATHQAVTLIGFGTFKVRSRKARQGVNPQTREPMTIPGAEVPVFVAGQNLKVSVKTKKKGKSFLAGQGGSSSSKGGKGGKAAPKKPAPKKKK